MSSHEIDMLKIDVLIRELDDVQAQWDILGIHLGFSHNELRVIELDSKDTKHRTTDMLNKWLKKEENPSWERIIAALETMSELNLASQLRKKYIQQYYKEQLHMSEGMTEDPATERVLLVDRKDIIARDLECLKEKYVKLVMRTESALEAVNPSPRQLKRFSQSYIKDLVVTTVEGLFDCLGEFCFLDYALLENTISIFLNESQPVVSDLSDYIQQLNNFKKSTTVKEFMQTIESLTTSVEKTKMCTVTLRLVGGWLTKTMEDLDKLLKEIFQDKSSILTHLKIVKGSVLIAYLAPQSEADFLIDIANVNVSFMHQVGVVELQIGSTVIIKEHIIDSDFGFESSLIKAVVDNDMHLLSFLLDINTTSDAIDSKGQTALMYGSYYGREKAIRFLLNGKANIDFQTNSGNTALYIAAQEGQSGTVNSLLNANANPNVRRTNGSTPLFIAAQNGHSLIVSYLLKANANPNYQKNDGTTPLLMACQNGHIDVVSILLKANVNPNQQAVNGATPLCIAAEHGHVSIVKILLESNASPNIQTDDGITPSILASQNGHADVVSQLLRANANPNLQTNDNKSTALTQAAAKGHFNVVDVLLTANADPNLCRDDGSTPLLYACLNGHPKIVQLLLTSGADPNLQSNSGATALTCAFYGGCLESTKLLLMFGANTSELKEQELMIHLDPDTQ